jgi:hypothetical protein
MRESTFHSTFTEGKYTGGGQTRRRLRTRNSSFAVGMKSDDRPGLTLNLGTSVLVLGNPPRSSGSSLHVATPELCLDDAESIDCLNSALSTDIDGCLGTIVSSDCARLDSRLTVVLLYCLVTSSSCTL